MQRQSIFQRTEYKTPQKRTRTIINTRVRFWARFMWVMHFDHHLTTPSSQPGPCVVCTLQHSFITTTNSAGSCAYYTISGAGSLYFPVRHSSPLRKAAGSNPVSRTKKVAVLRYSDLFTLAGRILSSCLIVFCLAVVWSAPAHWPCPFPMPQSGWGCKAPVPRFGGVEGNGLPGKSSFAGFSP